MIVLTLMNSTGKKYFKRSLDSLLEIFEFTNDFFLKNNIPEPNKFAVDLSIEEIFTNMIKYQPESNDDIEIIILCDNKSLKIQLICTDVKHFDVTNIPDVNTKAPLEERKVGGLGLYIVNKLMDKIDYSYENQSCRITLTKILET